MSRIRSLIARDMSGAFISEDDRNKHEASHSGGDMVARAVRLTVALTPDDAARAGLPFWSDFTGQGTGFRLFDGKTAAGTLASVKRVSRREWEKATNAVLCTPSPANFARYGAAVDRSCPVVVIHAPTDTVDLDNLFFAVVDAREVVRSIGGWGAMKDTTGAAHVGRAGKPPVSYKWVTRKNQNGKYAEVSVRVPRSAWRSGTVEELHAAIDALA